MGAVGLAVAQNSPTVSPGRRLGRGPQPRVVWRGGTATKSSKMRIGLIPLDKVIYFCPTREMAEESTLILRNENCGLARLSLLKRAGEGAYDSNALTALRLNLLIPRLSAPARTFRRVRGRQSSFK